MQSSRTPRPDLRGGVSPGLGLPVRVGGNQTREVLDARRRRSDVQKGRGGDGGGRADADDAVGGFRHCEFPDRKEAVLQHDVKSSAPPTSCVQIC